MLIYLSWLCIVTLSFGISFAATSDSIKRIEVRYDTICGSLSTWSVTFKLTEDIEDPLFYYRIDNFYSNHKNYVKSKSVSQLRGSSISSLSTCSPIEHNIDVGNPTSIVTGATLQSSDVAYPCGLIAKYKFTDTFKLYDSSGTQINLDDSNIALSIDKSTRFKNSNNLSQQWQDFTDQHFMVWNRIETFPWFDKLYAKISSTLKAGIQYTVTISNKYIYSGFDIKKRIVISSAQYMGKDPGLGVIFLFWACLSFILIIVLFIFELLKRKGLQK